MAALRNAGQARTLHLKLALVLGGKRNEDVRCIPSHAPSGNAEISIYFAGGSSASYYNQGDRYISRQPYSIRR